MIVMNTVPNEDDSRPPPPPPLPLRHGQFAKLLMVDTAIVDHLPLAYEDALHALYGDGLGEQDGRDAKE